MSVNIWIKQRLRRIYRSIAFIPSMVILVFVGLSVFMIYLDYSDAGKNIKAATNLIRLKDPSTARTIISVIAAGLISLTVFSFSMVMVVLNQVASKLSNRVLDNLVGNRVHQFIIGFYIGNIVFALLLLSSIRDIESGVYVPALSAYLLILLSVIAIFLFVFFLHYITQSIKYTTIITRIKKMTHSSMKESCNLLIQSDTVPLKEGELLYSKRSGIFETFDRRELLKLASKHDIVISFRFPKGSFVLKENPIAELYSENKTIPKEVHDSVHKHISIVGNSSENNYYWGFKQLTEIAIKALSPGINDPGTATESLQALFTLLTYRRKHFPEDNIRDDKGVSRIITRELSFDELFDRYILPVWDYGKDDRIIRDQMTDLLRQLHFTGESVSSTNLLLKIHKEPFGQ